jgi:hypothetical protein
MLSVATSIMDEYLCRPPEGGLREEGDLRLTDEAALIDAMTVP